MPKPTADNVQWELDRRLDRVASPKASQFGQGGAGSAQLQGGHQWAQRTTGGPALLGGFFAVPAPWMVPGGANLVV